MTPAREVGPAIHAYRTPPVDDVPALLARLRVHEAQHGCRVQLVRPHRVYGRDHLALAAHLAERAYAGQRARSNDLATETLLYASGDRQVGKALRFLGLEAGARAVAALCWAEDGDAALSAWAEQESWRQDDALLAGDESVLEAFGVGIAERGVVPREKWGDLVLERVALLDVAKP